ncbi:ankyrin repeat and LEM domain-containing protein 2 isoform X2 [Chanos chanos]|uniref:Ankyrin repeat and LEM domain-containing protein 2 n=1 Tax=Chanos chanos TaxID=29144 RepID=A0A6J2V0F5_CHACN|nr:ankyrin repeat and LEM domain-containing protein 2-like isoform X2 [Chanos chanos]
MEAVLSRLKALTPEQLREEITKAGLKCGPITVTTRAVFEKKLARAVLENQAGDSSVNESESHTHCVDHATSQTANSSEAEAKTEASDKTDETDGDASQQVSHESSSVYYGVCPPLDDSSNRDGKPHVYVDREKALKAMGRMKGSRFKAFHSREDAEKFAKGETERGPSPQKPSSDDSKTSPGGLNRHSGEPVNEEAVGVEKANEFRSPRTQDLTGKLKKAVEMGDEEVFSQLVWSNPRYLIGSGDNPTIIQEGCRYNVLHVAAKENQPGIARLLLETLESPAFMRLMYPDDKEMMLWQRIRYIVDLYLNTPDKVNNETPLHFACKFGCPEVVDVLCSHPAIDKKCRNKYSQTPSSVICERKNKSKEIKQRIKEYLEDRWYVPLLRATDNTLHPLIGLPWSPGTSEYHERSRNLELAESPKDPRMAMRAFVGPLSRSKAEEFQKLWKTPPRGRAKYFHGILKSDPDRGAERVGRELAHEMGHPWAEYWHFLSCFIDLSDKEGLTMLEEYLKRKSLQENCTPQRRRESDHIIKRKLQECGPGISPEKPGENTRSPVCNLLPEFERVTFQEGQATPPAFKEKGKKAAASAGDSLPPSDAGRKNPTPEDDQWSCSSEEYFTAEEESEDESGERRLSERHVLACSTPCSCRERGRSCSESSGSSYESTQNSLENDSTTEDRDKKLVFIEGDSPTKLDNEVLLAMSGKEINKDAYPCIARWRDSVLAHPMSERQRWPSAAGVDKHDETQAFSPSRLTHCWITGSPNFTSPTRLFLTHGTHNSPSKLSSGS